MTKQEFEAGYIGRSGITQESYDKDTVTLPCACGADNCEGWAAVGNTPRRIRTHMELYAPNRWPITDDEPAQAETDRKEEGHGVDKG